VLGPENQFFSHRTLHISVLDLVEWYTD